MDQAAVTRFVEEGFLRLDNAFPPELAAQARAILWRDTGCDPDDPQSWTRPVIRLGMYGEPPFRAAAGTPALAEAFDALVGEGRWLPIGMMGTFPVRFPSAHDPGDTGWHIDVSFGQDKPDFLEWRANITSRGRALLLLFLFSDVGEDDAPTRIRIASHIDIARQLAPAGEAGMTLGSLAADGFAACAHRPEALAIGAAGTVYLCHPFLVPAANSERGAMGPVSQ